MIRRVAIVVVALSIHPALLFAQDGVFTVTVASADVHKGPTTVTPVIGQVSRDTVLPVLRNLGSWVKVPWPDGPDGSAYVHITMGRLGTPSENSPAARIAPRAPATTVSAASAAAPLTRTSIGEPVVPRGHLGAPPASHVFGIGGLVGVASSYGVTARAWRTNHLAVQFGVVRRSITSDVATGRLTSTEFEPGVVYAPFDHVSDYVWIRPYVGSTMSYGHQTLAVAAPLPSASDNGIGFRVFGGSEVTFAMVPRFGISADVGYRRFPTSFAGFDTDPLSVSIAGHWYIK